MFEGKIHYGSKVHIHKELHKVFKFQSIFDLEGQGQGHQFSNTSETLRCKGKTPNRSILKFKTNILQVLRPISRSWSEVFRIVQNPPLDDQYTAQV